MISRATGARQERGTSWSAGRDAERAAAASGVPSGAVIFPGEGQAVASGALRHAESDAAMVMAEQPLEVPAGAARALLVGVEKDVW